MSRIILPALTLFTLWTMTSASAASAQDVPLAIDYPLTGVEYDERIPRPEAVIGHVIGTRHTTPHEVVDYFEAVAAVSDRVELRVHGATYEGRALIHAVVTSPRNHGRIDAIRAANATLSDSPSSVTDEDLAAMPVVLYQGYSIHGNEASGTEAAVVYLYHLAAARGADIENQLENAVILLDPLFNPDGRDRFVDWVNRNRGAVHTTDGQDREHNEEWPGGRTNHYFFDLNRDWLPAQLAESKARIELFHAWRPQVLTDHHEMGGDATFFFQPGIPSRTNPNTPDRNQELTGRIATYHAAELDAIGSLYYSKESFDDFYYGKGSTFPDINGAVGILFEQASSRALESATDNGPLHYAFTVRNQFATSLSTLRAATEMREQLLSYQRDFYAGAAGFARDHRVKAYVIGNGGSAGRARGMIDILLRHRIRVFRLARDVSSGGIDYPAATSFVVPVDQPQARLIASMMEERTSFTDSLFYDVSSWTMPHAFNLPFAEWTSSPDNVIGEAVALDDEVVPGQVAGGPQAYAFLIPWGEYYLPREVYRLQEEGIRVRMTTRDFAARVNGQQREFSRGTLIVPAVQPGVSREAVRASVETLAVRSGVDAWAVSTGLAVAGSDLGTSTASVLEQPRVALLAGSGSSSSVVGEIWHLLGEHFSLPVSLLDTDRVGRSDLSRYNVIITTGSADADAVREWVRSGGTLIAVAGGVSWAASNDIVDIERRSFDADSLLEGLPYDQISNARGAQSLGGSIFRGRVDVGHPIAYGFDADLPLFRRGTTFYDAPETPGVSVVEYDESPLISGYATGEHLELASEAMAVASFRVGGGRVVVFADDPVFRAFWWGPASMLMNAIFLTEVY